VEDVDLATALDELPSELMVWHDGPAALPRLLALCTVKRSLEVQDLIAEWSETTADNLARSSPAAVGPFVVPFELTDHWRHTVMTLTEWAVRHQHPNPGLVPVTTSGSRNRAAKRRARRLRPRPVNDNDYETAIALAREWMALDTVRIGLRTGDISVDHARGSQGNHVWVTNRRRADIEVMDIMLSSVTAFDWSPSDALTGRLERWFFSARRAGAPDAGDVLNHLPPDILTATWDEAEESLESQGTTISPGTDIGGLTLGDARTCYAFLLAQLRLNHIAAIIFESPETLLWALRPEHLVRALGLRVTPASADAFVDLCTFTPGRNALSAPLIPHRDQLLIPSELVSPIAFERTLLRAATATPGAGGRLGNILGERAERWSERLATVPGCEVASSILVKDENGRTRGDLDVVAWDPERGDLMVIETKWPVDAATLPESFKVDAVFDKGRTQLLALREAIASGQVRVSWPDAWDLDLGQMTVWWWVGTAQQLESRDIDSHGVGATSLRMVEHLMPVESLADLAQRMLNPPLPKIGRDFVMEPISMRAGSWTIHSHAIQILTTRGPHPLGRRVADGWT
jgi:hypothetical protein